jgi:hypothetical protein
MFMYSACCGCGMCFAIAAFARKQIFVLQLKCAYGSTKRGFVAVDGQRGRPGARGQLHQCTAKAKLVISLACSRLRGEAQPGDAGVEVVLTMRGGHTHELSTAAEKIHRLHLPSAVAFASQVRCVTLI